ncbi:MAG: hypothetical protein BWY61_01536 [Firmicutes bacterium ADurb.Bin354]|nr:MAG: hypothetical protein BWY61_01536 [Firmicutes bacterium ADurb.Bin354]
MTENNFSGIILYEKIFIKRTDIIIKALTVTATVIEFGDVFKASQSVRKFRFENVLKDKSHEKDRHKTEDQTEDQKC